MASSEDISKLKIIFSAGEEFHYDDWHKGVYTAPCQKLRRYLREISVDKSHTEKTRSRASELITKLDVNISNLDRQMKELRSLGQKIDDLENEFEALELEHENKMEESEKLGIESRRLKRDFDAKGVGKKTISRPFFESRAGSLSDIISKLDRIAVELDDLNDKMKDIVEAEEETAEEMGNIHNSLKFSIPDFFTLTRDICDFISDASNNKGEKIEEDRSEIASEKTPFELLKHRLAKGEITKEEYLEIKKMIEEP